jgi:hypothetical protein
LQQIFAILPEELALLSLGFDQLFLGCLEETDRIIGFFQEINPILVGR